MRKIKFGCGHNTLPLREPGIQWLAQPLCSSVLSKWERDLRRRLVFGHQVYCTFRDSHVCSSSPPYPVDSVVLFCLFISTFSASPLHWLVRGFPVGSFSVGLSGVCVSMLHSGVRPALCPLCSCPGTQSCCSGLASRRAGLCFREHAAWVVSGASFPVNCHVCGQEMLLGPSRHDDVEIQGGCAAAWCRP